MASKHKHKHKRIRTKTKLMIVWIAIALFTVICVAIITIAANRSPGYSFEEENSRYIKNIMDQQKMIEELPENYVAKFDDTDICVCFGDSITGLTEAPYDYPSIVASNTGMTVINAGYGGCRMAVHPAPEYDAFSMYRLADSISTGNWVLQEQYVDMLSMEGSRDRLDTLKKIKWAEVDVVTIAFGTNDINGGVPKENAENRLDTGTVLGALRYSIEKIQKAYPHIKVMVVTPIYRFWIEESVDSDHMEKNGHYFIEWVDGMIDVAEEYHLPCVDLYRNCGFNAINRDYYFSENDGIHPNHAGQAVIGRQIAAAIRNYY